jgi:hypothetical protein
MKTVFRICILCAGLLLGTGIRATSDEITPPPPPSGHGEGGNHGPAGAPIDGGLGILLSLGLGYGMKKYVSGRKDGRKSEPDKKD